MPRFIAISIIASIAIHIMLIIFLDRYAPDALTQISAPTIVSIVEEPAKVPPAPSAPSAPTHPGPPSAIPHSPMPLPPSAGVPLPEPIAPAPAPPAASGPPRLDLSDIPMPSKTRPDRGGVELLDERVMEEYAMRAERERMAGNRLSISTDEFKYRGYMTALKARVERVWRYPKEAIERNISGDLYIEFFIKRDGSLGWMRLARTSGYPSLDGAAMKALRDSSPFMPMPSDWEDKGMVIMGQFIYRGRGLHYVR